MMAGQHAMGAARASPPCVRTYARRDHASRLANRLWKKPKPLPLQSLWAQLKDSNFQAWGGGGAKTFQIDPPGSRVPARGHPAIPQGFGRWTPNQARKLGYFG